jgi:CRISPR-associated protein Cas2
MCWVWKFINLLKPGGKNMYVILVYDIGEKRVGKMLKLCRQYLNWIQNSVFEGELSEVKLKELLHKAKEIMQQDTDSIIVFKSRQEKWLEKQVIGKEKNNLGNII